MDIVTLNLKSRIRTVTGATFELKPAGDGLNYIRPSKRDPLSEQYGLLISNELLVSPDAKVLSYTESGKRGGIYTRHELTLLRASIALIAKARILVPQAPLSCPERTLLWIPEEAALIKSINGIPPNLSNGLMMSGLVLMRKGTVVIVDLNGEIYRVECDGTTLEVDDLKTVFDPLWA